MSRIASRFAELKGAGRTALIPFVTAGDPDRTVTVPLMHAMVQSGADLIELGVPFSDPMADGPVIQRASERALEHHVSLRDVLAMVREFRSRDGATPVVLMGYLNPIEIMGYREFARQAAEAGVDGVLTVDSPPEEGDEYLPSLREAGLDPIYLIAPTTSAERGVPCRSTGRCPSSSSTPRARSSASACSTRRRPRPPPWSPGSTAMTWSSAEAVP